MSLPIWRCPLCSEPLALNDTGSTWRCSANHCFDRARGGYVNLLPVQNKRSRNPGDDAAMVRARADWLGGGHYEFLDLGLRQLLQGLAECHTAIDCGCGEGYFSRSLTAAVDDSGIQGIDLSKAAVKQAARRIPDGHFAVASSYQLPVYDQQFDLALVVMAPLADAELRRVLKRGGHLVWVTPAARHLLELRCELYDQPVPHEPAAAPPGFALLRREQVSAQLHLDSVALTQLVGMTPYAWRGDSRRREQLLERGALSLQACFDISVYRPLEVAND